MLSWLVILANMKITVLVDNKKIRYLSRITAARADVELAGLPGPQGNVSLPVPNTFAPTDHVELAGLPGPHGNFLSCRQ